MSKTKTPTWWKLRDEIQNHRWGATKEKKEEIRRLEKRLEGLCQKD